MAEAEAEAEAEPEAEAAMWLGPRDAPLLRSPSKVNRVCARVRASLLSFMARGGSGDLLAGLIGGLLAQTPSDPLLAACRGMVWHGIAADLLARAFGQTAVQTTQLLDFLAAALRESRHEP